MKKFLIIALFLLTIPFSASAKVGDVTGEIYSTDIRTFINGVEVASYNIGGRTAVIIEDVLDADKHGYAYDNYTRTLSFNTLEPKYFAEQKIKSYENAGKIIGSIYETDIKATVYDVVLPSYNIGGKTAVAIEDLGCDGGFSNIGGRYIWNDEERTLSLEFLYSNQNIMPNKRSSDIVVNKDKMQADITFAEVFHCEGNRSTVNYLDYSPEDIQKDFVFPIKAQGETIGYYFHKAMGEHHTAFSYYYPEKLEEAVKVYTPYEVKTREEVIDHFLNYHCVGGPAKRFDTEDYSFVYISVAMTSSTSYNLVQAFDDGTYIDYGDQIQMRNRSPHNLTIDEENEKVTFKYVDRYTPEWYTNYEIDLKTATIKEF